MVDEATVRAWLAEIGERIRTHTAELTRLHAEISADTRRQTALKALLTASTDGGTMGAGAEEVLAAASSAGPAKPQPGGLSAHPIEQGAIQVLAERSKPLHISELRAELARRGIPIPGKGTDANVIVYLSRCKDICRVGRGLYALRTWNVPEVPARRRRSVRKRRRARG